MSQSQSQMIESIAPDVECVACYSHENVSPEDKVRVACLIGIASGIRFGHDCPLCETCLETLKNLRKGLNEGLGTS